MGGIGRGLTEFLLARGHKVRALVRREDERAEALRRLGAEVVTGDLTDLASMHHAIEGCRRIYFGMSVSRGLPGSHDQHRRSGAPSRRRGFREHVADDGHADEHQRDHQQPTAQAALAVRVGAVLVGTAGRHGAADSLPRGFLSSNRRPQRAGLRRVGAADGRRQDLADLGGRRGACGSADPRRPRAAYRTNLRSDGAGIGRFGPLCAA